MEQLSGQNLHLSPQCRILIPKSVPVSPVMIALQLELVALVFNLISLPLHNVRPNRCCVPLSRPFLEVISKIHIQKLLLAQLCLRLLEFLTRLNELLA